ncbi:MAG: O-antigen ligase family protein, partial [Ignavibacteriae bacterium]|nr:O-antigen ligase family protein [Ignavibacteriota bacterium]
MSNRLIQILFALTATSIISINFSIAISSITMGAAIILLLGSLVRTRFSTYTQTPLDYFILMYAVAELLATIFSVDSASSLFNMKRLFLISIFYLIAISVDEESKLKWLFIMFVLVASMLSVFEIFSVTKIGGKIMRVSLFQYFLTEGGIKMIMLLMLIPFIIHPATPKFWRWFTVVSAVPLFVGLILTQTRSSWLGFIVGTLTIGLMKSKKLIFGLILLVVLVLAFAPSDFRSRAATIFDPNMKSNLTRIHMVTTGWQMFLDKP